MIKYPQSIEIASRKELCEIAMNVPWYHCIELGDGLVTKGVFDLRRDLHHYGFPEDMRGMTVLDVGRSSGYFSFEFEKRGAIVTATDLVHKEFVGGEITQRILRRLLEHKYGETRNDFFIAHKILQSNVTPVVAGLHNLAEVMKDQQFDLVFVGSVLNHVRDPAGALQQLFSVAKGRIIIANPIDTEDRSSAPRMKIIGLDSPSLSTWYVPNVAAMTHLIKAAGFQNVHVLSEFRLSTPDGGSKIPHAVFHGDRLSDDETERVFLDIMKL